MEIGTYGGFSHGSNQKAAMGPEKGPSPSGLCLHSFLSPRHHFRNQVLKARSCGIPHTQALTAQHLLRPSNEPECLSDSFTALISVVPLSHPIS